VTGTALGVSSITWSWTLTSGATGYRILSSTNAGANISGDLPGSAQTFTLTGLSTNTLGAVMVEAFGAGFAVDAPTSSVVTLAAKPSGTLLLGTLRNQVTLSWQTNGNESAPAGISYDVNWTTGTGTGTGVLFSTNPAVISGTATATINDLPGGMTVSFDVQALNSSGVASGFDVIVATTIPAIDNQAMISSATFALGVSSITWYWTPSTGASRYQLFSNSGVNLSGPLSAATFSFIQTGLLPNTSYTNYIEAFDGTTSTNTTPFTRYTLAAQTTGLTLLGLSSATVASDSETELLSWGANGNPDGTKYNVLWWSNLTSTVTISTGATTARVGNLFAGSTLYFTVQAVNNEQIPAAFDATFFTLGPSTDSFPVANQVIPVGFAGILTFVVPNVSGSGAGVVSVQIASGTFTSQVTFTVSTPTATGPTAFPTVGGNFSDLPSPIHLTITADDTFGNPQQPLRPILISISYAAANFAANQTTLDISRFDTLHQTWIPLATSKSGSTLSAVTDHLSSFAVLSVAAASGLSSITVGPNPLRPVLHPGEIMTFRNLPAGCRVRLFTYVGEKIIDLIADGSGTVGWDGRNRAGAFVASGVYVALIQGGGTKKTMRVAVER
jgi:hypothetical protein